MHVLNVQFLSAFVPVYHWEWQEGCVLGKKSHIVELNKRTENAYLKVFLTRIEFFQCQWESQDCSSFYFAEYWTIYSYKYIVENDKRNEARKKGENKPSFGFFFAFENKNVFSEEKPVLIDIVKNLHFTFSEVVLVILFIIFREFFKWPLLRSVMFVIRHVSAYDWEQQEAQVLWEKKSCRWRKGKNSKSFLKRVLVTVCFCDLH